MIVVGVVGVLCGLGGSVGAVMLRGSAEPNLAQELAALGDSTAVADTLHGAPHAGASPAAHGDSATLPLPLADAHGAAPAAHTEAAAGTEQSHPATAAAPIAPASAMEARKLAKIFAAMRPREAALVLNQMQDDEIQTILGSLADRQAAAILGALPPERVAAISRAVIAHAPEASR